MVLGGGRRSFCVFLDYLIVPYGSLHFAPLLFILLFICVYSVKCVFGRLGRCFASSIILIYSGLVLNGLICGAGSTRLDSALVFVISLSIFIYLLEVFFFE
jgi:hypothetical protein